MVTKGIIRSINRAGNRCIVRMPLFETAAEATKVEVEATINITPGFYNNLFVNDVVFVVFEENALEKPVVIGKLFTNTINESNTPGGAGVLDSLKVRTAATIPCTTLYEFPAASKNEYKDLKTPKKVADYIKWLEKYFKNLLAQMDSHFACFKNWTQWQLRAENVEIDDGDLDAETETPEPFLYQKEGEECKLCGDTCTKDKKRCYLRLDTEKKYPSL